MKILVTGAAGFIGSKLMFELAKRGDDVTGLDCINDYYDTRLKYGRLKACGFDPESVKEDGKMVRNNMYDNCKFIRLSLSDKQALDLLFEAERFEKVMNLAAQAGVRYSITNPYAYLESNLVGFLNVLEACRNYGVKHLVYASSSSVYGLNDEVPYKETANVDSPVSLYAATKRAMNSWHTPTASSTGLPPQDCATSLYMVRGDAQTCRQRSLRAPYRKDGR